MSIILRSLKALVAVLSLQQFVAWGARGLAREGERRHRLLFCSTTQPPPHHDPQNFSRRHQRLASCVAIEKEVPSSRASHLLEQAFSRFAPAVRWMGGGGGGGGWCAEPHHLFLWKAEVKVWTSCMLFTFSAPCQMTPVLTSFPLGNRKYFIPWWRRKKQTYLFGELKNREKNSNV